MRLVAREAAAPPSGTTPLTATDSQAAAFAAKYLQYDAQRRVTLEKVAGFGSNQNGGNGIGTLTYAYSASSNSDGYNAWTHKTVETLADGTTNTVYTDYAGLDLLTVTEDHSTGQPTSGQRWATFKQYDSQGRLVLSAEPSAVSLPSSLSTLEAYSDLLHKVSGNFQYLADAAGLIDVYTYGSSTTATASSAGDALGYLKQEAVQHGELGTPVLQSSEQYFKQTYTPSGTGAVAATVFPTASETVYRNTDGTGGQTTSYAYTWLADANNIATTQAQSVTTTLPTVTTSQNGPGTADVESTYYDGLGNPAWTKDAEGYLGYAAWDPVTGAVTKQITDVDTANTADFTSKPTGWATPSSGGLHLVMTAEVDMLGRTTKVTDPKGNVTYTVYNDPAHEARTYRGWDVAAHTTTGPIEVVRQYRPAANAPSGQRTVYNEILTTSATPSYDGSGRPTGAETISAGDIQSLSRGLTNDAGQLVDTDVYFSLSGVTYSQAAAVLGSVSNDSASGNYHRTLLGYDAAGRLGRTISPTGTVTRTIFDGLGRAASVWVGTDDTGATDLDPDGSGSPNNMVRVSSAEYDGGIAGDGNLTKLTTFPGGGTAERVTRNYYDWHDRLVATKSGVQGTESTSDNAHPITYADLDNLGEVTATYVYDGDNVTVGSTGGAPDKPSSSLLRAKRTAEYDEQGRAYRTHVYSVDPADGTVGGSVDANTWFDHRGNVIKSATAGGAVQKTQYDGAGRVTKSLITDGGGDAAWSDADDRTGDAVLTQAEYAYDANGNVVLTTTKDRFHDETATGELGNATTGPKARVSYVAGYYDQADRPTDSADVGTNGGSAYTRPGTVPARSDTVLVTSQSYDAAGRPQDTTDPRGIVARAGYDLLGRTTQTTEAYTDGTPSDADDRITRYTYDGSDHVLTMTADLPSGQNDQTTQYVYGVTVSDGSGVNSNDLLKEVRYPDKSTGTAGTASSDKQVYTYNALGEGKTYTDQNGTVHTYGYDVLGRPTSDAATVGSGNPQNVDTSVLKLGTTYNSQGLADTYTSYDGSNAVVNQVRRTYSGLGQLTGEYQEHSGAVNTSTTPAVQYGYSDLAHGSRLASMTYPNGRVLHYIYNTGVDDTVGRLTGLADDDGSGGAGTHLEDYSYLGLGTVISRAHPEPGISLTYAKLTGESNGDAGDQYTGLDRFGRVVDQRWVKTSDGSATDRFRYGYDRDGNVLYKDDLLNVGNSELYHANGAAGVYDALNRLTDFRRGALSDANANGVPDTVAAGDLSALAGASQAWSLDALGNQAATSTDGATASRSHDGRNQVTGVGSSTLSFDANGNTTTDAAGKHYVYDAWNRLVRAADASNATLITYTFDAAGRRVTEAPAAGPAIALFYDGSRVVEERQGSAIRAQSVWGNVYVNGLVERDVDADGNSATGSYGKSGSGLDQRMYARQDANFDTTSVSDASGVVLERYVYDPYGKLTVLDADGSADADGVPDVSEPFLYQGMRRDAATGLDHTDHREYSPTLARPLQADPAGYIDGANRYQWLLSQPVNFTDPTGLAAVGIVNPSANNGAGGHAFIIVKTPAGSMVYSFEPPDGWYGPTPYLAYMGNRPLADEINLYPLPGVDDKALAAHLASLVGGKAKYYGEGTEVCSTQAAHALQDAGVPKDLDDILDLFFAKEGVHGPSMLENHLKEYVTKHRGKPVMFPPSGKGLPNGGGRSSSWSSASSSAGASSAGSSSYLSYKKS